MLVSIDLRLLCLDKGATVLGFEHGTLGKGVL
jgi:hypothetical protein